MLRLSGGQVESCGTRCCRARCANCPRIWPRWIVLLRDPALLAPIAAHGAARRSREGRPTIAMESYVRLMVVKQRTGWGYETLVREVSDSLHLRRFCLIALGRAGAGRVDGAQADASAGCEVVDGADAGW